MNGIDIQPINAWLNGSPVVINFFAQQIVHDNLSNSAQLEYFMINKVIIDPDTTQFNVVTRGNLTIAGQDYLDWNNDPDANQWIYVWSLNQLNLQPNS